MYFIPQQTKINLPILFKTDPLYKDITAAELPRAYLDLLAEQNGGYLLCSRIPTKEPTSDGIDYAAVHSILGLHDDPKNSLYAQQEIARTAGSAGLFCAFQQQRQPALCLRLFKTVPIRRTEHPAHRYRNGQLADCRSRFRSIPAQPDTWTADRSRRNPAHAHGRRARLFAGRRRGIAGAVFALRG